MEALALDEALIAKRSVAYDMSYTYDITLQKLEAVEKRMSRRRKWIRMAKEFNSAKFLDRVEVARKEATQFVFADVMRVLWQSMIRKVLYYSRIYNIKYYRLLLDELYVGRIRNIRTQWIVWGNAMRDAQKKQEMRELWVSLAHVLWKRMIVDESREFHKVRIHGEEEWRRKWTDVANRLVRRKRLARIKRRYDAIQVLTRFFGKILLKHRSEKAARAVVRFDWNISEFVKDDVGDSYKKIYRLAKICFMKKADRFAAAYADEVFGSAFRQVSLLIEERDTDDSDVSD